MFLGLPTSRWSFAARIWLAANLAWGVAFWVQLDGASSAGITAVILAMQTRGQILEKSAYRVLGTALGGVVSIVIAGSFAQARDLYILSYSAWLGACVFAAGFLDGNRAYGAVLSGYTVSIVAVFQIDNPGGVFSEAVNRGAAVVIGIASVTLIVDLLGGPEIGPGLITRIGGGCRRVRAFTDVLLRDGPAADTDARVGAMMRTASDQHPLLNALPVEAVSGAFRANAIRTTLAALVGEIRAARALARAERRLAECANPRLGDLVARRLRGELAARREASDAAYTAVCNGQPIRPSQRMPIYRSRENALWNGLRAFVASVVAAYILVLTSWPATAVAWGMTGIIVCLSSNAPDQRAMTTGALLALPGAVAMAGITKFLILDGVDAFPLLMLGTAPALFAGLLLISSPKPTLVGAGLLITVDALAIIAPSNPQSYDARSFLDDAILFVAAGFLVFVLVRVLFPTSDVHRRDWVLRSARRDLRAALLGHGRDRSDGDTRLLDASRIGTLVGLKATIPTDMTTLLRMADLARAARRVSRSLDVASLDAAGSDLSAEQGRSIRTALANADATGLRRVALALMRAGDDQNLTLAADLAWAADLIDAPAETAAADPSGRWAAAA